MSKVGVHIIGGVLVIPLTRGTNPCIGLAVSQDPRAPRVWGNAARPHSNRSRGGEGLSNVDSVLWHP